MSNDQDGAVRSESVHHDRPELDRSERKPRTLAEMTQIRRENPEKYREIVSILDESAFD